MKAFEYYIKQFPHYTPSVLDAVLPHLTIKNIKAGEYLLRHGQICKSVAFIEKGLVRLYYLNDGKEITKCFCRENNITCSYSSLITQKPSEVAIQAIEDLNLIVLSNISMQKLYEKGIFWQQMGRLMSENEYVATECHYRFLSDLSATERYLHILEQEQDLMQRVPLNYLASYLQIAPETLSRIRRKVART